MNPTTLSSTYLSEREEGLVPVAVSLTTFCHCCRYLNDLYTLEIREGTSLQWVCPTIEGPTPCPRESPAAVTVGTNRLLIYGGMNGKRLGDVWMLDVGELWSTVLVRKLFAYTCS